MELHFRVEFAGVNMVIGDIFTGNHLNTVGGVFGPCVTALLTGALIYIGQTGDAYLGGMALFALGIALLIIGTYAGRWLPKAGAWMNITKVIVGYMKTDSFLDLVSHVLNTPDT